VTPPLEGGAAAAGPDPGPGTDVSVVIPTFNRAKWIPETVRSVAAQWPAPLEIIVVDDGSTDGTEQICRDLPGVRYLRQSNRGVSAARNYGAAQARGEWLAFVDSDDLWRPGKLAVQLAALAQAADAGWSITDLDVIGLDGALVPGRQGFPAVFPVFEDVGREPASFFGATLRHFTVPSAGSSHEVFAGDVYDSLFEGNFCHVSTLVVRRALFARLGGFDEEFRVAEDTEFFHRLAAAAPVAVVMTRLVGWRVGQNTTLTSSPNIVPIIRNALTSLERAASLRAPLSGRAQAALARAVPRQWLRLAYTQLSLYHGSEARACVRRAWQAGAPASLASVGLYLASLLPARGLRLLHAFKRAVT
jgi:GT2 family glycosyltransferase